MKLTMLPKDHSVLKTFLTGVNLVTGFLFFVFPSLLFLTYDHSHVLKSVVSLNAIFEKK